MTRSVNRKSAVAMTAELVAAFVSSRQTAAADLPALISSVHRALTAPDADEAAPPPAVRKTNAKAIRASITPDALISFEDGKPYKMLKRHLTALGLSAEAYRRKWGLPADYPLTAPNYSRFRSSQARSVGLGKQVRPSAPKPREKAKAKAR